jgi:hypothetical protein
MDRQVRDVSAYYTANHLLSSVTEAEGKEEKQIQMFHKTTEYV